MKKLKILAMIFAIIAVIGLISFLAGTRNVNIGAFIFPAILAAAFAIPGLQRDRGKR